MNSYRIAHALAQTWGQNQWDVLLHRCFVTVILQSADTNSLALQQYRKLLFHILTTTMQKEDQVSTFHAHIGWRRSLVVGALALINVVN